MGEIGVRCQVLSEEVSEIGFQAGFLRLLKPPDSRKVYFRGLGGAKIGSIISAGTSGSKSYQCFHSPQLFYFITYWELVHFFLAL